MLAPALPVMPTERAPTLLDFRCEYLAEPFFLTRTTGEACIAAFFSVTLWNGLLESYKPVWVGLDGLSASSEGADPIGPTPPWI